VTTSGGAITAVGASQLYIDLRATMDKTIRLPIGLALSSNSAFGVVANDGNRDVEVIDLNTQKVADFANVTTVYSSDLPVAGTPADSSLKGKRFFNTGQGRWSLRGEGWGSCGACHIDGLTDNITWYFARGPRQTVSLDGSFASGDPTDQRIFNWSGIFDEVADFEGNVRGISGGLGALCTLDAMNNCTVRINTATTTPQQQGLQGSSFCTAQTDAQCPTMGMSPHSAIQDWVDITHWVQTIRSPRRPTNLVAQDVADGKLLFEQGQGNCVGCHSGAKWTISKLFYTPSNMTNPVTGTGPLSTTSWNTMLNGFPSQLFPSAVAANQFMRVGNPPAFEQLGCIMRPVGTLGPLGAGNVPAGVSAPEINVLELRQNMVTGGQGSGLIPAEPTAGLNPPSLLGLQVGAPFFHAGNARTLEEVFDPRFQGHYQSAVANIFDPNSTAGMTANQKRKLVAYLLSLDEDEATFAIDPKSANGGDICF